MNTLLHALKPRNIQEYNCVTRSRTSRVLLKRLHIMLMRTSVAYFIDRYQHKP